MNKNHLSESCIHVLVKDSTTYAKEKNFALIKNTLVLLMQIFFVFAENTTIKGKYD